jgi:hypothetical protein
MQLFKVSILALSLAACASDEPQTGEISAKLTKLSDTWDAERAWYQTRLGTTYNAVRTKDGETRYHGLAAFNYRTEEGFALTPGVTHVGGTATRRFQGVHEYQQADGTFSAELPNPWIDLTVCTGDPYQGGGGYCLDAEHVELLATATGVEGQYKITYQGMLPGDTAPTVSGEFIAELGVEMYDSLPGYVSPDSE